MRSIFHLCTPTQPLDSRFPTSLSMEQTAAANNSTRVLRSRLSGCQYLRPKEHTGAKSFLSGCPIPPCEVQLICKEENAAQLFSGENDQIRGLADVQHRWDMSSRPSL